MRTPTRILAAIALLGATTGAANATPSTPLDPQAVATAAPAAGRASVQCVIADQGALTRCSLLSESPPGAGLGAAALDVAPMFRRPDATPGEIVTIPMRFVLSPGQTTQAQAATSAP
jgi:TonB family protein